MTRAGAFDAFRRMTVLVAISILTSVTTDAIAQTVDDLVAQIDESSYRQYLEEELFTHDGDSRGRNGAEHDLARDFILNELTSFGLDAELHHFMYSYYTGENVVAVQPGLLFPDRFYIVGGHYDSVNNPGADDNASGVAGMLEIARVLSQYEFNSSIIYMAWDLEELGLVGSKQWVKAHLDDDIAGVLNMDMIAYNPNTANRATIYGKEISTDLKFDLMDALAQYAPQIMVNDGGLYSQSDNASFESYGFPGVCLIEYSWSRNPNYHRQSDSVDTPNYIDCAFATNLVRGVAGCLGTLAGLPSDDDCLVLDVNHFAGAEIAQFRVMRGLPGREVVIMYAPEPGRFEYFEGDWCVSFGLMIPPSKAQDRILARGIFDADGHFASERYVPARFIGTGVLIQAAMGGTCPDPCMSRIIDQILN